MNDLPKVFVNPIDKEIKNSQERTIVDENSLNDVKLDEILTKDKYSFNHVYLIKMNNNEEVNDSIIQINETRLLTINNGWINIKDIDYIKEIKK